MAKDSAAQIELGRSFHQMGTVNEKDYEILDFDWLSQPHPQPGVSIK